MTSLERCDLYGDDSDGDAYLESVDGMMMVYCDVCDQKREESSMLLLDGELLCCECAEDKKCA